MASKSSKVKTVSYWTLRRQIRADVAAFVDCTNSSSENCNDTISQVETNAGNNSELHNFNEPCANVQ